jgi:hypothetical protein
MGNGACQTGIYNGTFSCYFYTQDASIADVPDSGGVGPITGTLSFMLTQDVTQSGELSVTDTASGTFTASPGFFIAAEADVTGTLDCSQGKFNGSLINGVYGLALGGGSAPAPDPNNKFQGPLVSDYSGSMLAFLNGRWSLSVAGLGSCIGNWTATYVGSADGGAANADQ